MALVDVGNDSRAWEKEFDSALKLHLSLLTLANERDNHPKNSQAHIKVSSQLRQSLNQLTSEIQSLRAHLERLSNSRQLTLREKERRNQMIEELISKHRHLQTSLSDKYNHVTKDEDIELVKTELFNCSNTSRASLLGEYQGLESAQTNHTSNTNTFEPVPHKNFKQIQAQAIAEQDRGLEELSKIIGRQKQLAQVIGDEVESQNDLIDNITDGIDRTRDRMTHQTSKIGLIDRKDSSCVYWLVIIGLAITIIVVASIP